MNINTSNSTNYREVNSKNQIESTRRQVLSSTGFRQSGAQGFQNEINGEGGLQHNLVYRSLSYPDQINFNDLVSTKEVLQELINDFRQFDGKVTFQPHKKQEYSKRLLLLQNQISGLMRQNFTYSGRGTDGAVRTIDYLSLINEKQNQVVQLEKKIAHLQSQLRIRDNRQRQLQSQLERRFALIKTKNDQIQRLKNSGKGYADSGKSQADIVNNLVKNLCGRLQQLARRGGSVNQLQTQVQSWILGLPNDSQLKRKLRTADQKWLQDKYRKYVSYLAVEAGSILNNVLRMYTSQIDQIKSRGVQVDYDQKIIELLGINSVIPLHLMPTQQIIMSSQVINNRDQRVGTAINMGLISSFANSTTTNAGTVVIGNNGYMNGVRKVVQVPVQDARTKALIYKLASQMRRLYTKYPKLATQISPQLSEFFSQQVIDVIQVDQLDRLVQIVKYKPEVVKVQNVYAYSSQKSRRVEFHLRVLIKALLDQMQRMRLRTGIQPQIDEGVVGMIRQQVMDVVDVDDILKVYRVVPKIVEVQKVVQQVVEKIVPIPHYVTVTERHNDIVPYKSVEVVENTVNVPLQVPKIQTLIHQKLVMVPQYHEKVVVSTAIQQNKFETVTQVPSVRSIDKVIPLIQDNIRVQYVPGPQKIVTVQKQIVKTIIEEKIVPVQRVIEKIVQVPQIIQKIVTVIQQVPKIIQIQKIVEKIVNTTQYVQSQRVQNFVVQKPVQVQCIVQRLIPVDRIVERVVQVPQIVQKIVKVVQRIQIIKQVQVVREVPIYQTKIQTIQVIKEVAVPGKNQQVIKSVDRIVEVPFIHEKYKVQTQYRRQPVIERQSKLIREPVNIEVPVVLYQQKIIQVPKTEVHVVTQEVPRDIIKQKIVPYETVRQQLIPAPCIIQKIIQKLVEVPRIVQIQKIVQKIVPIPRIVQKIVEVEKIVQKIVQRIIYQTQIKQIQYITQVPIEVCKVQTIEVPTYMIERVQVPHYIQRDRVIKDQTVIEKKTVEIIEQPPRVVIQRRQVPIQIIVQKLVPLKVQDHIYVQLKQQIVVPVQIQVPKNIIQQRIVPIEHTVPVVQQVVRQVQRVVQVNVQMPGKIQPKDRIVQKLFVQKDVKVVRDQIPYYNDRIVEVQRIKQKIVPVERVVKEVMQIPYMVQKIVNQIVNVTNVKQIERMVQVPIRTQEIITVQKIVPKVITLNKAFAQIVDRLHQIPRLAEQMKKVNNQFQTIVPERHSNTEIRQAQIMVQKAVIEQKLKQVDRFINTVSQTMKIVERIIQRPSQPIIITEQRILQVPVIVQKIAERIIIMPQIVQVLKYIHQITDTDNLGLALTGQVSIQQAQYQRLGKSLNGEIIRLRSLLQGMRSNPEFKTQINIIDNFLTQFNKFVAYPRIREVKTEKVVQNVVQKDRIVKVPVQSIDDERRGLASAVLIDKLIIQLKKLKQLSPQYKIDSDIIQIFGDQLQPISQKHGNNYNQMLDQYAKSIFARFNMYGTWTTDHQRMLRQFIDERFQLANRLKRTTKDSIKYRQLYDGVIEKYNRQKGYHDQVKGRFSELQKNVKDILSAIVDMSLRRSLQERLHNLSQVIYGYALGSDTITYQLKQMGEMDKERVSRYIRQKDELIKQLKITIENLKRQLQRKGHHQIQGQFVYGNCNQHYLDQDISNQLQELRRYRQTYGNKLGVASSTTTVKQITSGGGISQAQYSKAQAQITRLKAQITKSRQEISKLQAQIRRLRQIQAQHRGCSNRIKQLQERIRIIIIENQKFQKEVYELKSIRQTKRTTGSITTPQRQIRTEGMSDSYGTNYMEYVRDGGSDANSSGVRSSKAQFYQKAPFRSGGNPGTSGSNDLGGVRGSTGSVSGTYGGTLGRSTSGGNLLLGQGQQGQVQGQSSNFVGGVSSSGGVVSSSTAGGTVAIGSGSNSGAYIQQQRSTNYLTESRGSGVSGASGVSGMSRGQLSRGQLSRGEISNRSSKVGGQTYGYQETYQKQQSSISRQGGEVVSTQRYSRAQKMEFSSGNSGLYGTSVNDMIRKNQ